MAGCRRGRARRVDARRRLARAAHPGRARRCARAGVSRGVRDRRRGHPRRRRAARAARACRRSPPPRELRPGARRARPRRAGRACDAHRRRSLDRNVLGIDTLFVVGDELFGYLFRPENGWGSGPAGSQGDRLHAAVAPRPARATAGGPDAFGCFSCHSKGGPDGAGTQTQNAFMRGDGERTGSADQRNAPHLLGLGPIALPGARDERRAAARRRRRARRAREDGRTPGRAAARRPRASPSAASSPSPTARSNDGGVRRRRRGSDDPSLRLEGPPGDAPRHRRGVAPPPSGPALQPHPVRGARRHARPADPYGKGPWYDVDEDGVSLEIDSGMLTTVVAYLAQLEVPTIRPPHDPGLLDAWAAGRSHFDEIGCAGCHVPTLELQDTKLDAREARRPGSPRVRRRRRQGRRRPEDRARSTPATTTPYLVHLFSDLKRHDMGDALASPAAQGDDPRAGLSHPPALGPRRDGALSARRSRADRARRDRAPRRRGDRRARRLSGARRAGTRQRARLPDVAVAPAEALRAMTSRRVDAAPRCSALGALRSPAAAARRARRPPRGAADCPSLARPAPLSLDAARDAQRLADASSRAPAAGGGGARLLPARDARRARSEARGRRHRCASPSWRTSASSSSSTSTTSPTGSAAATASTAPAGPFRRVHGGLFGGPETISCPSCHWIGGPNGAGAETDDAFLEGDGQRTASGDERNPPALVGARRRPGAGARDELATCRSSATISCARPRAPAPLARRGSTAKGVDFGVLRASAKGEVDTSGVRGVDPDLVVKPFGWKGTLASFTDFAAEALQMHMGIQSDVLLASGSPELVGNGKDPADPDGDGVRDGARPRTLRRHDGAPGAARAADRRAADPGPPAPGRRRTRCCRRRRRASRTISSAAASSSTSSAAPAATCR